MESTRRIERVVLKGLFEIRISEKKKGEMRNNACGL